MVFAAAAVERAMKIQEVIMRALSGAITWLQAADILGLDPRSVRRWRARYDAGGRVALYDRRCLRPSRQKAPALEVQRSEEHTSELQSHHDLVCRLLLEKKKKQHKKTTTIE